MNIAIAVRSARTCHRHPLSLFSPPVEPPRLGRRTPGAVSFRNSSTQSSEQQKSEEDSKNNINNNSMDTRKKEDDNPTVTKTGDVMAHSFGEGYATRSDEEGFGGTYGGNDSCKVMKAKDIDEDHPEYDKSQGSEVKEKEKARHQTNAHS
ncbi:hypothetical protein BT93_L4996 [Corymbia citriodora subsp. variegata]|uniref:Late embryogenesis abundant protein n=1 Tax=Corymbia citriodora subsp. variegata TaxID=360336 RepID=A0A8T0CTH2_CORYI|nr:hypothetical protein BT93_L4996 [Corymbia citriodora subsp. variegata]